MQEKGSEPLYRCVACGAGAAALTRSYGPTVLKLATCKECGGIVDKYIEYDPVIVMIDLILVTREAQRHVLYNTGFHIFWKLFVILALLETYGVWCKHNIINLSIETLCRFVKFDQQPNYNKSNLYNQFALALEQLGSKGCMTWNEEARIDDVDPFISEKTFYIAFASVSAGTAAFTCTIHVLMKLARQFGAGTTVPFVSLLKTVSLGNMSNLFTLPLLIWGLSEAHTKSIHILLVFSYNFLVFTNALIVMYNHIGWTAWVLLLGYWSKLSVVFVTKCVIVDFV